MDLRKLVLLSKTGGLIISLKQSFMNALSNYTVTVDQSKVVCYLLSAFFKQSGEPYEWSGVLIEPWPTRRWLCVAVTAP